MFVNVRSLSKTNFLNKPKNLGVVIIFPVSWKGPEEDMIYYLLLNQALNLTKAVQVHCSMSRTLLLQLITKISLLHLFFKSSAVSGYPTQLIVFIFICLNVANSKSLHLSYHRKLNFFFICSKCLIFYLRYPNLKVL